MRDASVWGELFQAHNTVEFPSSGELGPYKQFRFNADIKLISVGIFTFLQLHSFFFQGLLILVFAEQCHQHCGRLCHILSIGIHDLRTRSRYFWSSWIRYMGHMKAWTAWDSILSLFERSSLDCWQSLCHQMLLCTNYCDCLNPLRFILSAKRLSDGRHSHLFVWYCIVTRGDLFHSMPSRNAELRTKVFKSIKSNKF